MIQVSGSVGTLGGRTRLPNRNEVAEKSTEKPYKRAIYSESLLFSSKYKPALSPTARWWHLEIEEKEFGEEELPDLNPKLIALLYRFWYRWGNSTKTKSNIEIFGRKLKDYCRGERLGGGQPPRIAPWWKPTSD